MSQGLRTYDSKGRLTLDSTNYTWNLLFRSLISATDDTSVGQLLAAVDLWNSSTAATWDTISTAPIDAALVHVEGLLSSYQGQLLREKVDIWKGKAALRETAAARHIAVMTGMEQGDPWETESQLAAATGRLSQAYAGLVDAGRYAAGSLPGASKYILIPAQFTDFKVIRTHVGSPMNRKTVLASVKVRNGRELFLAAGSTETLVTVLVR